MLEHIIFNNLVYNETYMRKVMPFLTSEYFKDPVDRAIFNTIDDYVKNYNSSPTKEALAIDLSGHGSLNDLQFSNATDIISKMAPDNTSNIEWLVDQTEKFCQEKAIYNAIMRSIEIIDDKTGKVNKGSIPKLLSDAIAVSFDTSIGHDFLAGTDDRYDYYHQKVVKIPFDLAMMNKITRGGVERKTINVLLGGTGSGKTLALCHFAASHLAAGYKVLYITLEMAEMKIAERIDSNLLDIAISDFEDITKETYVRKVERMKQSVKGKLIVKEYPTAQAGSANFRHLINELRIKKNFVPDVVYVDYINICSSSRIRGIGSNINSYTYIKAIAEELRGLAVEFNVAMFTATQTTRGGYGNSDIEITDTSESFGLPATADFMVALIVTEELDKFGQMMIKQLKNRYADASVYRKFIIGIDRSKMRLYDIDDKGQLNDVPPSPPSSNNSSEDVERRKKLFGEFR